MEYMQYFGRCWRGSECGREAGKAGIARKMHVLISRVERKI